MDIINRVESLFDSFPKEKQACFINLSTEIFNRLSSIDIYFDEIIYVFKTKQSYEEPQYDFLNHTFPKSMFPLNTNVCYDIDKRIEYLYHKIRSKLEKEGFFIPTGVLDLRTLVLFMTDIFRVPIYVNKSKIEYKKLKNADIDSGIRYLTNTKNYLKVCDQNMSNIFHSILDRYRINRIVLFDQNKQCLIDTVLKICTAFGIDIKDLEECL